MVGSCAGRPARERERGLTVQWPAQLRHLPARARHCRGHSGSDARSDAGEHALREPHRATLVLAVRGAAPHRVLVHALGADLDLKQLPVREPQGVM